MGDSITFGCMVKNHNKNNCQTILGNLLGEKYCVNNFAYTNRTVIKVADKTGIRCIDIYNVFENKKELFSDGVHPNAKGSKLFAQTVYEAICRDMDLNKVIE